MGIFFVYSLKVALYLTVFYLLFKVLLSRDTFHHFKRLCLWGAMGLSLILPLVQPTISSLAHTTLRVDVNALAAVVETADAAEAAPRPISVVQVFFILYFLGVALFILRDIVSVCMLRRLIRRSTKLPTTEGYTLVLTADDIAPFSWFRYIVLSQKDYAGHPREILTHEAAHIHKFHSVDIMCCNALIALQWFNPAAWLMKREMEDIHEYEADEAVLRSGVNAQSYQMLLIKKAVGERLFVMANNMNHSTLTKRIKMMHMKKSNPWNRMKTVVAVPVAMVGVLLFANSKAQTLAMNVSAESDEALEIMAEPITKAIMEVQPKSSTAPSTFVQGDPIPADDKDDKVYTACDVSPKFPGGEVQLMTFLTKNIRYPETSLANKESGLVLVKFIIEKDGSVSNATVVKSVSPALDAEALRVVGQLPKWTPGFSKGKAVRVEYNLPLRFKMQNGSTSTTEKAAKATPSALTIRTHYSTPTTEAADIVKPQLVIVDGKEVSKEEMAKLNKDDIKSVAVFKGDKAIKLYGEKGRHGVMVIRTKQGK